MAKKEEIKEIEQQLEAETGHDVVVTGKRPLTFVETEEAPDAALHGKPQEVFIANDETGEITILYNRLGYAPRPIPAGWRAATDDEIAGGKHG